MELMHTQKNFSECSMKENEDNGDEICPICHGTGWVLIDDDGQGTARSCSCRDKIIWRNRIAFANIPETFEGIRINSFNTNVYENEKSRNTAEKLIKAINYWLDNFESMNERGMGLYLYSNAKGSGKTRMAVSLANELIYEKETQVKFATSLQIINEIKASWDKDGDYTENRLLDFLSTTKILIIDDFGAEQEKDWIGERFYQIINSRYINRKITIYTSNHSLEALRYDDRITDRIKERTFQIPFPEESVRGIIAKKNMKELVNGMKAGEKSEEIYRKR